MYHISLFLMVAFNDLMKRKRFELVDRLSCCLRRIV